MTTPDFSGVQLEAATSQLSVITQLVEAYRLALATVEAAETQLSEAQAKANKLQLYDIPDAMKAAGLTELKLEDRSTLVVKEELNVNVSEVNRRAAFAWLRRHQLGSIIKSQIIVDARGAGDAAKLTAELQKVATKYELELEAKETIHAATLKSTVKELLEKGTVLPPCFSVHQFNKAGLKEPKTTTPRKAKK